MLRSFALSVAAILLLPTSAGAQQSAAASPERWFAIAWEGGSRRHLGPFSSLATCEAGRMDPDGARRAYESIAATQPQFPPPPPNADDATVLAWRTKMNIEIAEWDRKTARQVSPLIQAMKFWEKNAICERI